MKIPQLRSLIEQLSNQSLTLLDVEHVGDCLLHSFVYGLVGRIATESEVRSLRKFLAGRFAEGYVDEFHESLHYHYGTHYSTTVGRATRRSRVTNSQFTFDLAGYLKDLVSMRAPEERLELHDGAIGVLAQGYLVDVCIVNPAQLSHDEFTLVPTWVRCASESRGTVYLIYDNDKRFDALQVIVPREEQQDASQPAFTSENAHEAEPVHVAGLGNDCAEFIAPYSPPKPRGY